MSVDTEMLLALKAFYMGHAIAEKPGTKPTALAMISAAIQQLHERSSSIDLLRLAFYHLLRAEIERHGGSPVSDRSAAKDICFRLNLPLFDHYMTIEQATQGKKVLGGIQSLTPHDPPVKVSQGHTDIFGRVHGWTDFASEALGLHDRDFSQRDQRFLHQTTLKQMLDKHGVSYAP